mmetsp:Transcript_14497/g.24742  ORF Transcript_14497/g.24742 Transcript_14497/m.24742 type:complete len:337 (+) Transcript_14497:41-1051(+)
MARSSKLSSSTKSQSGASSRLSPLLKGISKGKKLRVSGKSNSQSKTHKPRVCPKVNSKLTKKIDVFTNQKDYFKLDEVYEGCGFGTRAIHAGNTADPVHGGVIPSLELSTTYKQPSPGQPSSCFDYSRCGNPTVLALQRNLASLEGCKFAFALNSGMSATISVMSLLKQGDHLLCIDDVYGGTQRYLRKVFTPQTGITWDMIDMSDLSLVKKALKKNTKIVWIESPTNPTLKCSDIAAISRICKLNGSLLVIDNTFMSPALQNPLKLGADIAVHSMTKYLGGHSDVLGGAMMFNSDELYEKLYWNVLVMGTAQPPFEAFLAQRGAKTLDLRIRKSA